MLVIRLSFTVFNTSVDLIEIVLEWSSDGLSSGLCVPTIVLMVVRLTDSI